MTQEVPQSGSFYPRTPETYPQPGLFNVAAMTDEQIVALGRALDREHSRMADETGHTATDTEATALMSEYLGADIAQMTTSNPDRGRGLLSRLSCSDNVYDRNLAAVSAVPLALRGDYEFARDTLFAAYQRERSQRAWREGLVEECVRELDELLATARPDLRDDFQQRWSDIDPED